MYLFEDTYLQMHVLLRVSRWPPTFEYKDRELSRHKRRSRRSGGLLTFEPSIPKSLLLGGEHNLQTHFTLVNYQEKRTKLLSGNPKGKKMKISRSDLEIPYANRK
ncbi:hypothetical protein E3N88_25877 [Mikania micrantha]|uniref:Uncharacterized protein n=1 Tax=Mikania micrantha TaxID=192012 RepID=A0A5N6N8S2_9ASTR|nr:hypothetical protein E3N88_25877 [Mikania micrantha]